MFKIICENISVLRWEDSKLIIIIIIILKLLIKFINIFLLANTGYYLYNKGWYCKFRQLIICCFFEWSWNSIFLNFHTIYHSRILTPTSFVILKSGWSMHKPVLSFEQMVLCLMPKYVSDYIIITKLQKAMRNFQYLKLPLWVGFLQLLIFQLFLNPNLAQHLRNIIRVKILSLSWSDYR